MHNIAENNLNRTTSELDLCILVTHYWNFSKSKGHNSAENYSAQPKFKLNLSILLTHLYSKFQFKISISNGGNERKLKINGIFLVQGALFCHKLFDPTQIQTQPAYPLDTSIYRISIQNVNK